MQMCTISHLHGHVQRQASLATSHDSVVSYTRVDIDCPLNTPQKVVRWMATQVPRLADPVRRLLPSAAQRADRRAGRTLASSPVWPSSLEETACDLGRNRSGRDTKADRREGNVRPR